MEGHPLHDMDAEGKTIPEAESRFMETPLCSPGHIVYPSKDDPSVSARSATRARTARATLCSHPRGSCTSM
jgi:hypothetical protein